MATWLRKLTIRRVALVDAGANQGAHVELFKRAEVGPERKEPDMAEQDKVPAPDQETIAKVADLEKRLADAEAAHAELTKRAEAAEATAKTATEEKAKLEDRIEKLEEASERVRFIQKAESVPHLGKPEEVATRLRKIAKALGDAEFEEYMKKEVATANQLRVAKLFDVNGSDGDQGSDFNTKVEVLAKSIRTADPKLTAEQAYVKALEQMPAEEYAAYRAGSYVESRRGGK